MSDDLGEFFDSTGKKPEPTTDEEIAENTAGVTPDPLEPYCLDDLDRQKVRIFDSENLARGRHKDYDKVISDVVAAAKSDQELAKKIISAPDPAQTAYDMGKRLRNGDLDDLMAGDFEYRRSIDQY